MAKTIKEIAHYLKGQINDLAFENQCVSHLKIDSRDIEKGDLFIAKTGSAQRGEDFIHQALERGAIAILTEGAIESIELKSHRGVSFLHCTQPQLNAFLPSFIDWFYESPSQKMALVGVTGTNGKTTIAQLIAQWGKLLGKKTGSIGTLGFGLEQSVIEGQNTTPDLAQTEDWLAHCLAQQVDLVAMEVSSHGLAQDRVQPLHFKVGIFTNLTRDHLDFHSTFEAYEQAKWRFFSDHRVEHKIINIDDEIGKQWQQKCAKAMLISTQKSQLSALKQSGNPFICAVKMTLLNGAHVEFESHLGSGRFETKLMGEFNVNNVLLALSAMLALGFSLPALLKTAPQLTPICGRMEHFFLPNQAIAVVDYAHTPDALEKALKTLRSHCQGTLWVIFGCGGNRDKGKRALMAQVAEEYSDAIILTNDNPREEEAQSILKDIEAGFKQKMPILIADRAEAIAYGLAQLQAGDALLVAGKGHEDYQIIGKTKYPFSDQAEILKKATA